MQKHCYHKIKAKNSLKKYFLIAEKAEMKMEYRHKTVIIGDFLLKSDVSSVFLYIKLANIKIPNLKHFIIVV